MNAIQRYTLILATASEGNPIISTATIMLFYVMLNIMLASIETLIWGSRFEHWGDVIIQLCFIGYSAYAVFYCARFNASKQAQP